MYSDAEFRDMLEDEAFYRHTLTPPPVDAEPSGRRRRSRRPPPPENAERMGFRLQRALRAYRLLLWALYDELGYLPSQEGVLVELFYSEANEGQRDIALRLGTSRQSVTRSLGRLHRAELIERERAPGDRRQGLVRLTELGRIVVRHGGGALRAAEAAALSQVPARAERVLLEALARIEESCLAAIREVRAPAPPIDGPAVDEPTRWS